ncbi:uncharacterized protein A1O5_06276 [Cladophialophora psammophila CBS 110553]|uniref:Metallo-beta-lactamase domain-containing protein n=1 Tax=Cladophialophora psammophila CBS 110553 TaxID=1182543 RepID=W9WQK9_9EURO|nr:uncharacterized protein A1O5_06276 [Cladophialophora psammophila CBS 110553]EXJ70208.1 hypothetical protein A1O5_06276 [Cladophialophora psammophila CBS 110553]
MVTAEKFDIPPGNVARVRIIDTTTSIKTLETHHVMGPPMPGMYVMPDILAWSFLVESTNGRKALFDLGVPPNFEDFSPAVTRFLKTDAWGWQISSQKHVADILKNEGVNPASITDIVWSHWHWDHIGDPSTFPLHAQLVVGPGFKDEFLPGYPARQDSPVRESDFKGRQLREITFQESQGALQIGQFRAFDLFSDGSFYLLDTPGHATGHLAGLARTTADTFIMMGGDLCHHSVRPSRYKTLPAEVHLDAFRHFQGGFCPGSVFEALQEKRGRGLDQPFFEPTFGADIPLAMETITQVQVPDANDNVLFIYAHDKNIQGIVDMFPADVNDWQTKGWREKMYWRFLEDFKEAVEG